MRQQQYMRPAGQQGGPPIQGQPMYDPRWQGAPSTTGPYMQEHRPMPQMQGQSDFFINVHYIKKLSISITGEKLIDVCLQIAVNFQ